jgi:hypothetical protein
MFDHIFSVATQKLAVIFVVSVWGIGGFLASSANHNSIAGQTAIIGEVGAGAAVGGNAAAEAVTATTTPWSVSSTLATTALLDLPDVSIQLLPTTTVPFCTASSTCGTRALKKLIASICLVKKVSAATSSPTSVTQTVTAQTAQIAIATPAKIVAPTQPTTTAPSQLLPVTAEGLLANAQLTLKETRDGPFEITVQTNEPNGEALSWNVGAQTIGGETDSDASGVTPQMSNSFSCDPAADMPDISSPDQNPLFKTSTAYNCTLSLTPLSGADRRMQSRNFSVTTPPGQLFVTQASSINTVLTNDTNNGGIVFQNEDISPVTVTNLTFNITYTYLTTLQQPLVFRILNPTTSQSLFDYHLENSSGSALGVTTPISFTIPGMSQKMLPIQILGVDRMLMSNTTPSITVSLQSATTDRSEIKVNLDSPTITWSCTVSPTGYDPEATSGPMATGQACLN